MINLNENGMNMKNISHIYGIIPSKYSRIGQVKSVEDSL